jgi:2-oxoglutarate ferredoxin oxidoreductase subunit gamma
MTQSKNPEQNKTEIIITGFGGQGIVLAGRILGQAAALDDHMESTLVQSYGPESRGGACSAQVVISDLPINFPYIKKPDILVCMSQSGYDKYIDDLKPEGRLLIDQDLVKPDPKQKDYFYIPATRMAEELGRTMIANIIMIGFTSAITKVVSMKASQNTVEQLVPKGTEKLNIKSFNKGGDFGLAILKGRAKKAAGKTGAIS